jgi:hypothetical protein
VKEGEWRGLLLMDKERDEGSASVEEVRQAGENGEIVP